MLVTDRDRVLLGRQPTWPQGRYSALALGAGSVTVSDVAVFFQALVP